MFISSFMFITNILGLAVPLNYLLAKKEKLWEVC